MELFITVAALLVAIYSVASRERQLDLGLRFGRLDRGVVGTGFLLILYFEFYDFCEYHHLAVSHRLWPNGLTPHKATYLVIIIVIAWLGYRARSARLSPKDIFKFQKLAEELFLGGHFGELISILDRHSEELFRTARADFRLARLRRRLNPPVSFELLVEMRSDNRPKGLVESKGGWLSRLRNTAARRASVLLPNYEEESSAAQDVIRAVLLSRPFVQALATSRPYLVLRILPHWPKGFDRTEFVHRYLGALTENDTSILYTELEHNQGISAGGEYVIRPGNQILHFFLSDANVAYEVLVWKPLGDFVELHLDELGRHPEEDPYNRAMDGFERDEELWRSPEYAVTRFFDIMVTQALHQGVEYHMWLYYFPHIVERMVRNYRVSDPLSDPDSEFPNRYAYLLYEIFNALRGWILALEHIPEGQRNVVLETTGTKDENGNIPKSSILAVGMCLRSVLKSENVGERQKKALADKALEIYFDLRAMGRHRYAEALVKSLLAGGRQYQQDDTHYLEILYDCFKNEEHEYRTTHQEQWVDDLRTKLFR